MNVSLAKKIVKLTPKHVFHPSPSIDTPLGLSSGTTIPAVGLATWQGSPEPEQVKDAVLLAIKSGYRFISTIGSNEGEVGAAIHEAISERRVKREDLFVATRLSSAGGTSLEDALNVSVKTLGLEYVDLVLLDGSDESSLASTWDTTEQLRSTSKTRAIGLSNPSLSALEKLLSTSKTLPTAIQIQSNLYAPQDELTHLCHEKTIHVIASSPFRSAEKGWLFNHDVVSKVADKHSVVPENVLLSWHLARGSSVVVDVPILGGSEGHRSLVKLDEEDMQVLGTIAE